MKSGPKRRWLAAMVVLVVSTCMAARADADQRGVADIPVQVGVGPTGVNLGGPTFDEPGWGGGLSDDQLVFGGLRLSATTVIDSDLVDDHPGLVPRNYRGYVRRAGEVRFSPGIFSIIPSTIYLSPAIENSSAWGASWALLGAGLPLITEPVRASLSGRLGFSALYINSESVRAPYFFLRPGIELNLDVEIPVTETFLVSVGWSSNIHVPPQPLQGGILDAGGYDEQSLWHIGQLYLQGHFRFPYSYDYSRR